MLLVIINSAKRDIYEIIATLKKSAAVYKEQYEMLQKMHNNGNI